MGQSLAKAALVLFGAALGFLGAEIGVRAHAATNDDFGEWIRALLDHQYGIGFRWSPHPFLPFVGTPGMEYEVQRDDGWAVVQVRGKNNAYGFRTHEFPFDHEKGPDDVVVLCFGGSTTWGAIAEENHTTWPGLLESHLQRHLPDKNVRVYNFGISTATSAFSTVTLSLLGVHLDPDLIVVYHGMTDRQPMVSKRYRTDQAHYFKDFDPDLAWLGVRRSLPHWMLSSYVVTYIAATIDEQLSVNSLQFYVAHPPEPDTYEIGQVGHRITDNYDTIRSIAEGIGAKTLFATFQDYDPTDDSLNDHFRGYFAQHGLPFADQDALIPDLDRSINIDDCHFTRKGREMMAQNFFDAIVRHGLLE